MKRKEGKVEEPVKRLKTAEWCEGQCVRVRARVRVAARQTQESVKDDAQWGKRCSGSRIHPFPHVVISVMEAMCLIYPNSVLQCQLSISLEK